MKKILSLAIALAITMSFASCAGKAPSGNGGTENAGVSGPNGTTADSKEVAKIINCKEENDYLVFTVSKSLPLTEDSWLGICEKGDYVLEDDADDAGVTYTYSEERETENEDYVFKLTYSGLEDGEYTMVLCDTDNNGYVMASWRLTLKDEKPAVDLSGFKINPRPADLPTPAAPAEPVAPDDTDDDFDEGEYEPGVTDDGEDEPDDGADDA